MPEFLDGPIRETAHDGSDDLLSAGLGLDGLRAPFTAFADALSPTPLELRRRAIHASWQGIADLGPLGGFGSVYGAVPHVPGREFHAFARVPGARAPHRVLLQAPDTFDARARCLLVAPSSGSRGVYGAIALAGAWGLPRGCAVAYTDKGGGAGYFDLDTQTSVALDGTRAKRGETALEFDADGDETHCIAVKHAHSGDHPEADWGRHVLQAAEFGLAMLDRAYPQLAPFTRENTRVIAVGLSNGGGAVLQAAGLDVDRVLAGVVALAPNVHVEGSGRAAYDYVTEAARLLPCALLDARFDDVPFARAATQPPPAWRARAARLRETGEVTGKTVAAHAQSALDRLHANGWNDRTLATAATTTAFDLWRVVAAAYASAYLRARADAMPCGFRYGALDAQGRRAAADPMQAAAWWADASGIPPGAGVLLLGGDDATDDPSMAALDALRSLWTGAGADTQTLRTAVAATAARLPRANLPMIVVHGEADGLLPIGFSSAAYVDALVAAGCAPTFWRVPHAQHFDAFLALPGFGERHVPLLPYAYAALERMWAHVYAHAPLPGSQRFATSPRGAGILQRTAIDL